MQMVAHHSKTADGDREQLSQLVDPVFDPGTPLLERAPRLAIIPAQPSATHTAGHAVEHTGLTFGREDRAGGGHVEQDCDFRGGEVGKPR